eukprot:COSAG02_NODE_5617_length_4179_cov_6.227451_3_plen_144_part_00
MSTIGPKLAKTNFGADSLSSSLRHTGAATDVIDWAVVMRELQRQREEEGQRSSRPRVYLGSGYGSSGGSSSGYRSGGRRGGGCFAAGTPVLMADGVTQVPIEELRAGDATLGGVVSATMQFDLSAAAPLCEYTSAQPALQPFG